MPLVSVRTDGYVATLTLAPEDGLAGRGFVEELRAAAEDIAARTDEVRAVVVAAAEADFCAGWSAEALAERDGPAPGGLRAGIEALAAVPQPVVAALRGRVHSAGLEIALACDVRIAAEDATFAMPELSLGMLPRAGGSQRLPRAIGRAHALRLLLLGDEVDAVEARRIGLVWRVVPTEEALPEATRLAEVIASRGPIATRLGKEAVHRGTEMPLEQALRYELDLTVLLQTTADRAEGVRAFAEKRAPRFTGQ